MSTTPGGPQPPFGPPGMPPANPYAAQGPPGSFAPPPSQPTHFGSYWWAYLLGVPALFFMCCCGGCFMLPFILGPDASAAYQAAADAAKAHPEVQARLGTPLTTGIPSQSQINLKNNTGDASYTFTVTGPKGGATIKSELVKEDGKWKPTVLTAKFDDNTSADLIP